MKVQLVNAPLSNEYHEISRSGCYQPLSLLAIATYLRGKLPGVDIEILDGDILPQDLILSLINADIVGISPKILTYQNSLEIAKVAKNRGALVVMGGAHATALADVILKRRDCVDAIVMGDGEETFAAIAGGRPWQNLSNIAYRENQDTVMRPIEALDLDRLPVQDNQLIDLSPYFVNFKRRFASFGFKRGIAVYSHKGCIWQAERGGCIFCRRFEHGVRVRNPMSVWEEIKSLVGEFSVDFVWDVSDSLTADRTWLREFAKTNPFRNSPSFLFYGRADQIDAEIATYLSELNCFEVLVGVESGDNGLLQKSNKGITVDQTVEAARTLNNFGIQLYPSFVLGLPGETQKTARRTFELAERLVEVGNVRQLACSTLIPLPQSPSFDLVLSHSALAEKYRYEDMLSVEKLRRDWVNFFCTVEYEHLAETMENILDLVPIGSSFGRSKASTIRPTLSASKKSLDPPPEIKGLDFTPAEKQKARERNEMLLLTVFTEMGCNLRCPYCFTRKTAPGNGVPLNLSEYAKLFEEAKELGVRSIWWVGLGEPLMYEGWRELIRTIRSCGLIPLVFTNGTLVSPEIACTMFDLGASVYIKLNSFDPWIQDELGGNIEGTFLAVQAGLKNLIAAGFNGTDPPRMAIQSVITKKNLDDIPTLYRWARSKNIIPFFEVIMHLKFPLSEEVRELDLPVNEMKQIFEALLDTDQEEFGYTWVPSPPYVGRQCDKYYHGVTVSAYGDLVSCAASQVSVGNVREKSLRELWNDPFLRKIRHMDELIEGKCRACQIDCTGCRAEAFAFTGNVFAEYSRCWR